LKTTSHAFVQGVVIKRGNRKMKVDKKMLPFEVSAMSFIPRKEVTVIAAKNLINTYFLLKQQENERGREFDFDKEAASISKALALLEIEGEITHEKSESIMKFLAYKQRERSYT